jgi:hypothetical protein
MHKSPAIWGVVSWLLAGGLQVSGYTNIYLAIFLWAAGAIGMLFAASSWVRSCSWCPAFMRPLKPHAEKSIVLEWNNLRIWPNQLLRERTIEFAQEMREFESNAMAEYSRMTSRGMPVIRRQLTDVQNQEIWNSLNELNREAREQHRNEFMRRYYPRAKALLDEISPRLGLLPPYQIDRPPGVLSNGSLAGVNPITQAADQIEKLARRLH